MLPPNYQIGESRLGADLCLLRISSSVLPPGNSWQNKGGASRTEASGGTSSSSSSGIGAVGGNALEEFNGARNRSTESIIATLEENIEQIELNFAGEFSRVRQNLITVFSY